VPIFQGSFAVWQAAGSLDAMLRAMIETFNTARQHTHCIVLVDEVDSAGDRRSMEGRNVGYETQVLNAFLEQLDGLEGREGVVVIGTTNYPERVDAALRRPGRLDREISLGLPDVTGLTGILRSHLGSDLAGQDLRRAANFAWGSSPAMAERFVRDARRRARFEDRPMIEADLLVFSDFNYGCLPQPLVDHLVTLAKNQGVMLAADSQSSSQLGDISRFRGMDLITPTEREARISTRNREDGLVVLAEQLRQQSAAHNVLLKLGEEGLLVHASTRNSSEWLTDRVDALNTAPKDVAGAGDSLLISSAMALACGATIWEAACLGSLAAAVQVGRLGNTPLQTEELLQELKI
jgi:SpoVK/Ycf46/Vps4 family AAA+-type ATPase